MRIAPAFDVGTTYSRTDDIHAHYSGQQQGGISTPAGHPIIFLFTGDSGIRYGYTDHWTDDGVYLFTGEGQRGDMEFTKGNKAIRDHAANGKSLYLFKTRGKGKGVTFQGEFVCSTWQYGRDVDADGQMRQTIVFHLVPEAAVEEQQLGEPEPIADLNELRRLAIEAASPASQGTETIAKRTVYERSRAVRAYVLARADGVCESCGEPAPFNRADGSPYLEPHHTRRVSDGGPDDPRWVGAVCANCHREIHHGENGVPKNERLQAKLDAIESI